MATAVQWICDGTLTPGESAAVCAANGRVLYQEWAPTPKARCEDGGTVDS